MNIDLYFAAKCSGRLYGANYAALLMGPAVNGILV